MKRFFPLLIGLLVCTRLSYAQQAKDLTQAIHYIKLASTLRAVDKSDASIDLLKRALPTAEKSSPYWKAVTDELLGLCYGDQKDTVTAVKYLQEAKAEYLKLKFVASAWGVNEVVRSLSNKNLYAGIQIGASNIKLAILKTRYETDFYEKSVQSVVNIPNQENLYADASRSLREEQNALRSCLDTIQRYNIPNERVFVVFSNDVRAQLARDPNMRQRVYNQLSQVLPNTSLKIDTTLTANREAELFTTGAIPRKVWGTTSALDLGHNSTVGGYFDPNLKPGPKTFHGISIPYGTDSFVARIDPRNSMNMDAFRREAQRTMKTLADSLLSASTKTIASGIRERNTVGIGGDAVWALVTYLHPERADLTAVGITSEDVERFRRMALNDYKELVKPDLKVVEDPGTRIRAENDIRTLQNQLSEKQLVVGALWLDAIMKAYEKNGDVKRFVFVRNADIGWVTGKFLETINFEYESTIAKGALYTR